MTAADQHEPTVQALFDLRGRAALVTGASGYLGSRIAAALAEAGAAVVVSSRDEGRAAAALAALPAPGGAQHHAVVLDHMDANSLERGFQEALARTGRIDVLVNNGHEALAQDWTNVTAEQFSRQLANATGYFLLSRLVRDDAVRQGAAASVIMLGSMYGMVASYPEAYEGICMASPVAYHALKGGVIHLTRHLAVYWAKDRVRVNCLSPGPFPNPEKIADALIRRLEPHCPMRRMGAAYELKGAVVFLASDASSYMTGQNLVIDGGWTAW
jgi:gluconate 5-dehydrogenase